MLNSNTWKHLTVCKQMINNKYNNLYETEISESICEQKKKMSGGSFKNVIYKFFFFFRNHIFNIYV